MPTIFSDVSYYNPAVDDSYPHKWLSIRACDGDFIDPKFAQNHAWAHKAAQAGKLAGYTVYCVFRPGVDVLAVLKRLMPKPDIYLTVMVDVESWGGQITGDHSGEITALCEAVGAWLGSRDRVLAYGNQGDLAALFPHRPSWLRLVVAAYGTVQPVVPGMVAWQYTDGESRYPHPSGLPDSSPPFGTCDHNIAPDHSPKELAALLGVGRVIPPAKKPPAHKPPTVPDTPHPPKVRHWRWRALHAEKARDRFRTAVRKLRARLTHRKGRR